MKQIQFAIENATLIINLPTDIYSKEAILNSIYWQLGNFKVFFAKTNENGYKISIDIRNVSKDRLDTFKHEFSSDLIDFELREIINHESQNVKELIIAKAFSDGLLDDLQ
jgi:His-Xaa-Ser system protein HxsD